MVAHKWHTTMTQSTFTLAQVISIAQKVAPNATIAELMNAINAETACNNAPQSETPKVDEPQTPKEESRESVQPARKENKPKKPSQAELASAYAKIQAYAMHNGVENFTIEDDGYAYFDEEDNGVEVPSTTYDLWRCDRTSDRKWGAICLSLRKSIETLGGEFSGEHHIYVPAASYEAALRAYKKQQRKAK